MESEYHNKVSLRKLLLTYLLHNQLLGLRASETDELLREVSRISQVQERPTNDSHQVETTCWRLPE